MQPPSVPASDSGLRLAVDVRRLPWMRRLALDYAFHYESLAAFFAGDPADPSAWAKAVARTQRHPRDRGAIASIIASQQVQRGAPDAARAMARRLADEGSVAVVTGQQAGLFGGPLFTLLKALTTIRLAEQVSTEHGVPAVPVFWIDAEDHDWKEISSCGVLDGDLALRQMRVDAPPGAGEQPVAALTYTEALDRTLEALTESLPSTPFTEGLVTSLRTAYGSGRHVTAAFGRWMEAVLGERGLVVYDAADPAAKPLAAPIFRRELERVGQTTRLATEAGEKLVERGYHAQVTMHQPSAALFHLDGGRRAILADGDGLRIDGDDEVLAAGVLLERASREPEAFSPNVLLRPIVQDTLFPTVCYVAGPNELAYLGQLRAVYESYALPMPLIQPRATATILDSAGVRFLTRYKVPLEAFEAQDEHALNELLRAQLPPSVEDAVSAAEREIGARLDTVIGAVPAIDPTLEGAARSTLGKLQHDIRTLRGKIVQAAKRRDETLRRQFLHVRAQAFPDGEPQERVVGFVTFLNKYGPALVDRLAAELPVDATNHWVITI